MEDKLADVGDRVLAGGDDQTAMIVDRLSENGQNAFCKSLEGKPIPGQFQRASLKVVWPAGDVPGSTALMGG